MIDDPAQMASAAPRFPAAIAVVDLSRASGKQRFGLVRSLRARFPQLGVIVVDDRDELDVGQSALDAGANGFVPKHAVAIELSSAVDAVLAGRRYLSARRRSQAGH